MKYSFLQRYVALCKPSDLLSHLALILCHLRALERTVMSDAYSFGQLCQLCLWLPWLLAS